MPSWLPPVLARVHELVALDALGHISTEDFSVRFFSRLTGEWMYVFKPKVGGLLLYVKIILRRECLVVSFHEEKDDEEGEE